MAGEKNLVFCTENAQMVHYVGVATLSPIFPQTKKSISKLYLILTDASSGQMLLLCSFPSCHLNSLHYSLEENFLQKKLIIIREIIAHISRILHSLT